MGPQPGEGNRGRAAHPWPPRGFSFGGQVLIKLSLEYPARKEGKSWAEMERCFRVDATVGFMGLGALRGHHTGSEKQRRLATSRKWGLLCAEGEEGSRLCSGSRGWGGKAEGPETRPGWAWVWKGEGAGSGDSAKDRVCRLRRLLS